MTSTKSSSDFYRDAQEKCERYARRHIKVLLEEIEDYKKSGILQDGAMRTLAQMHVHCSTHEQLFRAHDLVRDASMQILHSQFALSLPPGNSKFNRFYELLAIQCVEPPPVKMVRVWWNGEDPELVDWIAANKRVSWMDEMAILEMAQDAADGHWSEPATTVEVPSPHTTPQPAPPKRGSDW